MGQYGQAAILAVNIYRNSQGLSPAQAWDQALQNLGISDKPCPRTAFWGLAENGNIQGIPPGNYLTRNTSSNKFNAIAVRNLIFNTQPPQIPNLPKKMVWSQITRQNNTSDQGVLDVVYTLFQNGLLR